MYFVELSDGTLLNLFGIDKIIENDGNLFVYRAGDMIMSIYNENDVALVRKLLKGFTVVMKDSV